MDIEDLGVEALATSVAWFESGLVERGIKLDPRCALRQGLNALAQRAEKARARLIERMPVDQVFRHVIEATSADTLTKVLHRGVCSGLTEFGRHWKNLKSGNPLITGPSDGYSQERTKTWELDLASLCATFCENVHDEEPDVVVLHGERRIAVAPSANVV